MTDEGSATRCITAFECWHETEGILAAVVFWRLFGDVTHRRVEISQTREGMSCLAGFYPRWPAHDEGNSMAAFIDVSLVSTISGAGVMTVFFQDFEIALRRATIVAGKEDNCVVINTACLQGIQKFAHVMIHLHHKVSVGVNPAGVLEGGTGTMGV